VTVPEGTQAHRGEAKRFTSMRAAVLTVSDSRTLETDESGRYLREALTGAGHTVPVTGLLPNDESQVRARLEQWLRRDDLDLIVITGGTGLGSRDRTIEVVRPMLEKEMPGFGELFRMLSYQKVGTSTIQSRAAAGVAGGTYLFALPGSPGACKDAWDDILVHQLDNRHRPCNFVELMPRLLEHVKKAAS
jgi:molybdenum cofactor biosynthesis protein B